MHPTARDGGGRCSVLLGELRTPPGPPCSSFPQGPGAEGPTPQEAWDSRWVVGTAQLAALHDVRASGGNHPPGRFRPCVHGPRTARPREPAGRAGAAWALAPRPAPLAACQGFKAGCGASWGTGPDWTSLPGTEMGEQKEAVVGWAELEGAPGGKRAATGGGLQ